MAERLTGGCQCRAVRYEINGKPLWCAHCHCESCRRQTSAGFATFVGVRRADVVWSGIARAIYNSSPDVDRTFCPNCGSPLTYESEARFPGEVHFHIGSLDNPALVVPAAHVHVAGQLPGFDPVDDLPRFAGGDGRTSKPLRVGPLNADS